MKRSLYRDAKREIVERKSVLFLGVLPPPLHGQAKINQELASALVARTDLRVFDISPGLLERTWLYYARKVGRVLRCLGAVLGHVGCSVPFYLSLSSRLGLWLDVCFILIARATRCRVILHHHCYNYIDERSSAMSAVVTAAGPEATHVFACEMMRDEFTKLYAHVNRTLICSLARFGDSNWKRAARRLKQDRPFRIGTLSNLSADKGLYDALALVEEAHRRQLSVIAVLAGPASTGPDLNAIRQAEARGDGYLVYRGPVYGDKKEAFFAEIDAFVLPTRSESYGLVIIEALCRGIPVIAYARGCIASYLTGPAGYAIPPSRPFTDAALVQIATWINDPDLYHRGSQEALVLASSLRRQSQQDFEHLLSGIIQEEDARERFVSKHHTTGNTTHECRP